MLQALVLVVISNIMVLEAKEIPIGININYDPKDGPKIAREYLQLVGELLHGAFGDKNKLCNVPGDSLIFFEGNGCTENNVGSMKSMGYNPWNDLNHARNLKRMSCFDNDEARSVLILPHTKVDHFIVADNSDNYKKDDWTHIIIEPKLKGRRTAYCVDSFESNIIDDYVTVKFNRKNGLDGKVSRIGAWTGRSEANRYRRQYRPYTAPRTYWQYNWNRNRNPWSRSYWWGKK